MSAMRTCMASSDRNHLWLARCSAKPIAKKALRRAKAGLRCRALQARVRAALEALSEKDREALLLWDAGLGYPEIARQTGLAVGSVGTTLARARRRLAEAYREKEQSDVARG